MQYPKVTIITATYNLIQNHRAGSVVQTIESVHSQDYPGEIEHLVMDGGSTDGTLELLQDYENRGWIRIYSEKDNGLYFAMNNGISKASGKYIAILNSDDYWDDNEAIKTCVQALEDSNADFTYGDLTIQHADGHTSIFKASIEDIFYRMSFGHMTMVTKTDVLREANGFDAERFSSAADYDLILRLILNGKKPVKVNLNFGVFRAGGFSSNLFRDNCEVNQLFFKNLNSICPLTFGESLAIRLGYAFSKIIFEEILKRVDPSLREIFANKFKKKLAIKTKYKVFFTNSKLFKDYKKYSIRLAMDKCVDKNEYSCRLRNLEAIIAESNKIELRIFGKQIFSKITLLNLTSFHIFDSPLVTKRSL